MSAKTVTRLFLSAAIVAPEINLKCCKRSDLPLYVKEKVDEPAAKQQEAPSFISNNTALIEGTVRNIRTNIEDVLGTIHKYEGMGKDYVKEGLDNAQWLVNYLGDEQNNATKAPVIAIGGITGFIFGLRGGIIKKFIYSSIGALGMASICYPKEAKEYTGIAAEEARKYATIAYNFAYGVKKGEQPLELPKLPTFPSNLTEAISMITDLASSKSSASITENMPLKEAPKAVSEEDPCELFENYKEIGNVFVEGALNADHPKTPSTIKPVEPMISVSGVYDNTTCPCHQGSCMHPTTEEDCPETLPYSADECPCGQCKE